MGLVWIGLLVTCVAVTLTDAECHCETTSACAVFPSTPCSQVGSPDRCQEGWFGSYCQKQNIALRGSCSQSSILDNDANYYGAGLAVDGRATTDARSTPLTCAHTRNEANPTWTVNLNTSRPEKIQHIRLYLRYNFQDRSNGMEILVDSQMCYNWSFTEHPPPIANVTCRQPLTGTNVTIRIPGSRKFLSLCEVQIFVCSDGWFSEDCDKQCQCLNSTDVCDKITGHCSSGCFPGFIGADCQTACADGSFGSNCTSQCGHCLDGDICHKSNGTCPRGCAAGWQDDASCQQACPDGSYGINCASQCGNCLDGDICDKKTGTCSGGCAAGWMNDSTCLQPCADGSFGSNCASQCGHCLDGDICERTNGTCPRGCASGWMYGTCLQACPDGAYGINCASQCGNCLDGDICDKTNGTCPRGCAAGWQGDTSCHQACPDGSYGINCASQCGNCLDGDICDKKTGTCSGGCASGWINDDRCLQREGCNWGIPVAATLAVLLIFTVIGGTIYIRRLMNQLESLKTKMSEGHYVNLDERTMVPATESTYAHIDNATPYYNTVDHVRDET